jgi:alpha-D-ribose 1-methylphosphonate 5-triphosphate synthase subunit PhnH
MTPGFADPTLDAQASFRILLDAMAHPGRIVRLPACPAQPPPGLGPAAAALILTLTDSDSTVWLDAGAAAVNWAQFHAGCRIVSKPEQAAFLFATTHPPQQSSLAQGSAEEPHHSATLVVEVASLGVGGGWVLSGPGIETMVQLHVVGAPSDFLAQRAANLASFPCGVDTILTCGSDLVALPRTTQVEAG